MIKQNNKKSNWQTKPRPIYQLNPIKINSFLFKQSRHLANQKEYKNNFNQSFSVRFKTQTNNYFHEQQQQNHNTLNCASLRLSQNYKDNNSVDLTSRILKWNHLKNNKSHVKNNHVIKFKATEQQLFKRKSLDLGIKIKSKQYGKSQPKNIILPSKIHHSSFIDSDMKNMIQSYKQTQRIVFFQQLQQKKDKQRLLQYSNNRQKKNSNIYSRRFRQTLINDQNQLNSIACAKKQSTQCRPWSGEKGKIQNQQHHVQQILKLQADSNVIQD